MDYISKSIDRKIKYYTTLGEISKLTSYYQVKMEYYLILLLGYMWNKNLLQISIEDRRFIINKIVKPTIGDITTIIKKLDKDNELSEINTVFNDYPMFRNERIGHGYVFEDGVAEFCNDIKNIITKLECNSIEILCKDIDFIYVKSFENNTYKGIRYTGKELEYVAWICPKEVYEFSIENIYIYYNNVYFRISPFICINSEDELYMFNAISEVLTGKVIYNRINKTDKYSAEWDELANLCITSDETKVKGRNGTIINNFEKNYSKYIEIGIKKKISDFIINNRASVCSTIWGHGGVGKTASIQSCCEDLMNNNRKYFDYITFLSAKNRKFNYYTGLIEEIEPNVNSFYDIINVINTLLNYDITEELNKLEENIINYQGKLLIIIDDFETFSQDEKNNIEQFIKKLDVNHHKVIITTRANLIVGEEIKSNELNGDETIEFLTEIFKNEYKNQLSSLTQFLNRVSKDKIKLLTSGRPIFIYQFATILLQTGFNADEIESLSNLKQAKEFLYGKIYEYLSADGKKIFVAISRLVNNDETILLSKLQFITNMEYDQDNFDNAVNELKKLKVIEVIDNRFLRVYSSELLDVMKEDYEKQESTFKSLVNSKLTQISKDNKFDLEEALLKNADSSRYLKDEQEVISLYRQILRRKSSSYKIKKKALMNLTSYLAIDKGNKDEAIKTFNDFVSLFPKDIDIIKMYSKYNWSKGNKADAIKILKQYCSKNNKLCNENLDVYGLLLTDMCIYSIENRQETKNLYKQDLLTEDEYKRRIKNERDKFNEIFNKYGHVLFNKICSISFVKLSPEAKQNIATGLYQLIEVCIRINNYSYAKRICNYGLDNFPEYNKKSIKAKLQKINKFSQRR